MSMMQLLIYYISMFRRGKSHSQIGLFSKQLFREETHSNAHTLTSYAFGPSAFIRSEILTDHKNNIKVQNRQNSRRGKTFSSCSSKMFVEARSVGKEETFLKKKVESKQSLSSTKEKLLQRSEEVQRLKHKIVKKYTEVQRKLLITRVLEGKANNSPISIFHEINASRNILKAEKRNALTLLSNDSSWAQKHTYKYQESQPHLNNQTINKQHHLLQTEQNKELWSQGAISQELRPDLAYSYVNNDSIAKKEAIGMEEFKLCLSQMQMSLKQSIREEIEIVYTNKQHLFQNYQNALKQYDNKLTTIKGEVANKNESQQKMIEGLIKVFQSKVSEIIKKNVEQISKIKQDSPPEVKIQYTQKQETSSFQQRQQSIKKQVQKQVKEVSQVEEIQAVERKSVARQPIKTEIPLKNEIKDKQPAKVFKKNIYDEVSNNYQSQIEEIKLNLQSKNPGNSTKKNVVLVKDEIDLSFQLPEKHPNQSFQSERPYTRKEIGKANNNQKPIKTDKSASLKNYTQTKESPPQEKQKNNEQKPKQVPKQQPNEAEKKRVQLRKLLMKQTQQDPYLTAVGEVVGYCNRLMKKSKLKWRLPSLLLYRYCYDGYRLHTPLYEQGLKLGLLKQQDVQKFKGDSTMLRGNMMKVLKAVIKKNELDAAYQQLIQSEDNIFQKLKKLIDRQVKKFIDELWQSDEVEDINVLQCALRMINGVFIIRKLNGSQSIPILDKIDELSQKQVKTKFEQWVDKLDELLAKADK